MATREIRQAILDAIATIVAGQPRGGTGTTNYVYTFSGEDQVKGGRYERPPGVVPFACVWLTQIQEQFGPPLDRLEQDGTWGILAWVPGSPKHPEARQNAAEDVLDDLRGALRADITLGGTVLWHTTAASPFASSDAVATPDKQNYGICFIALSATWREARP